MAENNINADQAMKLAVGHEDEAWPPLPVKRVDPVNDTWENRKLLLQAVWTQSVVVYSRRQRRARPSRMYTVSHTRVAIY